MAHKDVGDKEARNRELRDQKRIAMNKKLIDAAGKVKERATKRVERLKADPIAKFKGKVVGRVGHLKASRRGK